MNHGSVPSPGSPRLRPAQLRMIALALTGAPLVFAVIVGILRSDETFRPGADLPSWFPIALTGVSVALIAVAFVIRSAIFGRIAGADAEKQLELYFGGTLAYFAPLEGAMLIGVIGWLLTGTMVPCVVPAALAFAIALASLPSDAQFESLKA